MKILFFVNRKTYLTKMSRVRFHGIKALSKLVEVKYWGLGWDGYNSKLTVQENIDRLEKADRLLASAYQKPVNKYDVAIVYKPLEMKNFKDINIPKCIRYNEMYDVKWTMKEIRESGAQLVICHHFNDYKKYSNMNLSNDFSHVKFVYIGHSAEKTIFKNYNIPKEYDILLGGIISPYHYPLRCKFLKLMDDIAKLSAAEIPAFKKIKVHQHRHPGYKLNDAHTDRYLKEYANKINKSKIVLACCSKWGYRLGKYIEIPMCGTAAICGDLPNDKVDNYDHVIEVTNSMTLPELFNKINYYLENEDKRLEKVKKGIEFAKNYTQEHYAKKLLKEIEEFL